MPKILKNVLLGVGAFLTLSLAIFAVYETVFAFFGGLNIADGKLTKGDILTSVSIAVAAFGAIGGWVLTSQHRQDDIVRLAEKERRVIEQLTEVANEDAKRIAEADALILYRRLDPVHFSAMSLLSTLIPAEGLGLVVRFPASTAVIDVRQNYQELENFLRTIQRYIPNTDEFFKGLHSIYVHKQQLGDRFVVVLKALQTLEVDVNYHLEHPHDDNVNRFFAIPNIQKRWFFDLLSHIALFLIAIEACRREVGGIEFHSKRMTTDLIELKNALEQLEALDTNVDNGQEEIDPDFYIRMLWSACVYFQRRSGEFAYLVSSGSN